MTRPTTVADNTQIGAYRVLEQLGQGGMGTVYLAEHTLLGRRAAIKVLHPQFSVQQAIVERFFNEARATTSIADPGIVQVFDFGFHDGTAYIVMELLQGETLLARMRRILRLPEVDVLRLARQLALSLHAAHARGVVHRDLKPDNIFIVPDPEALGGERTKVLDFGIAKLVDNAEGHHTQTGVMLGTPAYMSPEQCRGAGHVDHRSDIYSLGCLLFRCLTGVQIFDAQGAGEMIAMHLREPARPPSAVIPVHPELDAIIMRCLAKEPSDRYQTMHELAADVDALLRSISVPPGTHLAALTPLPPAAAMLAMSPTSPMIPTGELLSTPIPVQQPTTLSSAVSMREPAPAARKPRWPLIGVVAILLVGAGIATVVATTGGSPTGVSGREVAPATSVPAPPGAGAADPRASSAGASNAGASNAGASDPGASDPGAADPGPADAGAAEPGAAEDAAPASTSTTTAASRPKASTTNPKPSAKKSKKPATTKPATKNDALYDDR